jgi:hypothetical protein
VPFFLLQVSLFNTQNTQKLESWDLYWLIISMKGEGKMVIMSKMKWVGLVGLVLSAFSLFVHFLLARYTEEGISDYQSSVTIFSWRPIFENSDFAKNVCTTTTTTY